MVLQISLRQAGVIIQGLEGSSMLNNEVIEYL